MTLTTHMYVDWKRYGDRGYTIVHLSGTNRDEAISVFGKDQLELAIKTDTPEEQAFLPGRTYDLTFTIQPL